MSNSTNSQISNTTDSTNNHTSVKEESDDDCNSNQHSQQSGIIALSKIAHILVLSILHLEVENQTDTPYLIHLTTLYHMYCLFLTFHTSFFSTSTYSQRPRRIWPACWRSLLLPSVCLSPPATSGPPRCVEKVIFIVRFVSCFVLCSVSCIR